MMNIYAENLLGSNAGITEVKDQERKMTDQLKLWHETNICY